MNHLFCAAYCRCSTNMQDRSISDQEQAIKRFATEHRLKIITWFIDEDCSGTSIDKRNGFQKMKTLVDKGENDFSAILTYDASRWGRFPDPRESIYWEMHFEKKGVEIIYTNDDIENTKSFQSAIVRTIKHAAAGDYSRRLSVLITRAAISLAKEGFWAGGAAPYAYKRAEVDKKKRFLRAFEYGERCYNPDHRVILVLGSDMEVETVNRIFDYFVNREIDLRTIARILNRAGIPTPRSKFKRSRQSWPKSVHNRDKTNKWAYRCLFGIIRNQIYTGTLIWGVEKRGVFSRSENIWGDSGTRVSRHDKQNVIVFNKSHTAIVSEELFKKAQEIVCSKKTSEGHRKAFLYSPYLLSGMIECGTCGCRFHGGHYIHKSHGNVNQHRYYRDEGYCLRRGKVCSCYYIGAELLDNLVLDRLRRRMLFYSSAKRIVRMLEKTIKPVERTDSDIESLDKKIKGVQMKIAYLNSVLEGAKSYMNVQNKVSALMRQSYLLTELRRAAESASHVIDNLPQIALWMLDYYDYVSQVLDCGTLREKKLALRNTLERIVIDKKNNRARLYFYKVPKDLDVYLDLVQTGSSLTSMTTIPIPKRQQWRNVLGRE